MHITLVTESPNVRRTLESLLNLAGHHISEAGEGELTLIDTLHPPAEHAVIPGAVMALGDGALAYPLSIATLLQAITRLDTPILTLAHGWLLDSAARALTHSQHSPQPLTEKECALLSALLEAAPNGIARDRLLSDVWNMAEQAETHTLETHIYRLRAKLHGLTPLPAELQTVDGSYRLVIA